MPAELGQVRDHLLQRFQEEEEKAAEERAKKADFKIQIWFVSDRNLKGESSFTLSFWESGKRLHGGGDEMMFVCRRHAKAKKLTSIEVSRPGHKSLTERGCDGLIPGSLVQAGGLVVCPHCMTRHKSDQIGDSIFYRTDMDKAAEILAGWWRRLECNSDIYVKYSPTDPRTRLMAQTLGYKKARDLKGLTIYPLMRILADVSAGSSVEARFKALLTA